MRHQRAVMLAACGVLSACSQIVGAEFDDLELIDPSSGGSTAGSGGNAAGSTNGGSGGDSGSASGGGGASGKGGSTGGGGMGAGGMGGGSAGSGGGGAGGTGGSAQCPTVPASGESGIVINEIKGQGSGDDYIEIFNKSSDPVDVGNYYVGDDSGNEVRFSTGTSICGRSYVIALLQQTMSGGPYACFGFTPCFWGMTWGVAAGGEAVFLYDSTGVLLNQLTYPNEMGANGVDDGQAYGRLSDGDESLGAITISPGQPNQPAN